MVNIFRRWKATPTVKAEGKPLQAGQVESFSTDRRLIRSRTRLHKCKLKIEQLCNDGASESEIEPWVAEYYRRKAQIKILGG